MKKEARGISAVDILHDTLCMTCLEDIQPSKAGGKGLNKMPELLHRKIRVCLH